jgi:hypothetical protein
VGTQFKPRFGALSEGCVGQTRAVRDGQAMLRRVVQQAMRRLQPDVTA